MGFLTDLGKTLTFKQSKALQGMLKELGAIHFLRLLSTFQKLSVPKKDLQWGYELETHVVNIDKKKRRVQLELENSQERLDQVNAMDSGIEAAPEFGSWMVEFVPEKTFKRVTDVQDGIQLFEKMIQGLDFGPNN